MFYVVFHVGQSVGYNACVFDNDAKYGRCSTQEDSAQVDGDSLFDACLVYRVRTILVYGVRLVDEWISVGWWNCYL